MKRKLVKQGAATMMISLPSKWVKANKLEKGDEVDFEEKGDTLLIFSREHKNNRAALIQLTDLTESSIRTLITNTYRKGYDKINVLFDNKEQIKILENVIKTRLIGFEITKRQAKQVTVENITEPSEEQFDVILDKSFMNIEELFSLTEKRMKHETIDESFEEIEERIQKYDNFCRRIIMKNKLDHDNSELFWTFLSLIIHAQREIYLLNKLLDKKTKPSDKTLQLLRDSKELFSLLKKAYLEKNMEILSRIHEKEKNLIYQKAYSLLEKSNNKETLILYHLTSAIRQFYQANSPLAGLII